MLVGRSPVADTRAPVTVTVVGAGLAGSDLTVGFGNLDEAEQWVREALARERWERALRATKELAELRRRVKDLEAAAARDGGGA